MSIKFSFPFCIISNFGPQKTVNGSLTLTANGLDISTTKQFSLLSQTWDGQRVQDTVDIDLTSDQLIDKEIKFTFNAVTDHNDYLVLLLKPTSEQTGNLLIEVSKQQSQNFLIENKAWTNMPVFNNHLSTAILKIYAHDFFDGTVNLTYSQRKQTKLNLSIEENIEYYLGKDTVKNLHFVDSLPGAWDIPARPTANTECYVNKTIYGFFGKDKISYTYNNLGYRSNFDFTKETITKPVIICLGDSDTFGVNVDYSEIWTEKLQKIVGPEFLVLNMSVPGISVDGLARLGVRAITSLEGMVAAVCTQYSPLSLREFVSKKYQGGVHVTGNHNVPYKDWWDHIDWQSNNYNFHKNRLLLEHTCKSFNIPHHGLYINSQDTKVPLDYVEYGVYKTIGPRTHTAIANYFNKKILNKSSLFEEYTQS